MATEPDPRYDERYKAGWHEGRRVCLREVVDALSMQACRTQMGAPAAEYIERQFTPERRKDSRP